MPRQSIARFVSLSAAHLTKTVRHGKPLSIVGFEPRVHPGLSVVPSDRVDGSIASRNRGSRPAEAPIDAHQDLVEFAPELCR